MAVPTNPCCPVLSDDPSEQKPFVLALASWLCCPSLGPHTLSGPLEQSLFPVTQMLAQISRHGLARWAGAEGLQG